MKLSLKFFCIAYIVVLLSTGIGSAVVIQNSINRMWNAQVERVQASENYAINSLRSLINVSTGIVTGKQKSNMIYQVKNTLDSCITDLDILLESEIEDEAYRLLDINDGWNVFFEDENRLMMESVCKVNISNASYYVRVSSDFTELQNYRLQTWRIYSVVVLCVAAISGLLLYIFSNRITKPLHKLTMVFDDIASGNYGETVDIKTSDREIYELAESFNSMSIATENALNERKKEAERRERFVADFTHEMKTPMTSIIGYADMLMSYELSAAEQRQAAMAIHHEGKRLEQLSKQLLELMVMQNDDVTLTPVRLSDMQDRLEQTLRFVSEKYNISCLVRLPDVQVKANAVLLLSLLYNLADNAFKASKPGQQVHIFGIQLKDKVKICVQDAGHGIGNEHMEHLTEAFYREDKARSRKQGGAGLGLSLCKQIADIHNTELKFESEQGKGTLVLFELSLTGDDHA